MKRFIALTLLVLACTMVFSQNDGNGEIPEKIQNAFDELYPDSKLKGWEIDKDHYIARAKIDGIFSYVYFTREGEWIESRFPVDERELPSKILEYVDAKFADLRMPVIELVETADDDIFYFIEVRKEGLSQPKMAEMTFNIDGKLIHREDFIIPDDIPEPPATSSNKKKKTKKVKDVGGNAVVLVEIEETKPLDESQVPEGVVKYFSRRFPRAEEVQWDTVGELYEADCYYRNLRTKAYFTEDGAWQYTREDMMERMYGPVLRYIDESYPGYRIFYAEKETRADRKNSFYVEVYEKPRGKDPMRLTKLYFDRTGRIIKAEEPDIIDDYDIEEEDEDAKFAAQMDDDFKSKEGKKSKSKLVDAGAIKERELPSSALAYIYSKYDDYRIRESIAGSDDEYGEVYRVFVGKEGVAQESYEIMFDVNGEVLIDNVPKSEKPAAQSGYTDDDEEIEAEYAFPAIEVPEIVEKSFSRRVPRAEEVTWEVEGDYFTASYYYRDAKGASTFDKDGILLQTKTELFEERVPRPMLMYMDENYPAYKIQYAEKVVRKDRKNYYYMELYTKKKKLTPKKAYLFFDKTYRYIEEAPEL